MQTYWTYLNNQGKGGFYLIKNVKAPRVMGIVTCRNPSGVISTDLKMLAHLYACVTNPRTETKQPVAFRSGLALTANATADRDPGQRKELGDVTAPGPRSAAA